MNTLKGHFPSSKEKWKTYFKVFYPIILGAMLFAFNGFTDNFMVGHIDQGQTSLGAANSWTNILNGIFLGTAASGSVIMAQYFHAGKFDKAREVARLRYLISISAALIFGVLAITIPTQMNEVFLKRPSGASVVQADIDAWQTAIDGANNYIRITALQWLLVSITFNMGNQLRELGHGFISVIWGVGTLVTNITLNSILMYVVGMGVEGAAWASVAARCVAMAIGMTYIVKKKLEIGFNPISIFKISRLTQIVFWKRWFNFFAVATVQFFITFRTFFYDAGYPAGVEHLGVGVSGVAVLGLTGAIFNIFTTTFNALGAMSAKFVASELGKGNIQQAKINANELKGFNTTMSFALSVLCVATAFLIPYMHFLSEDQFKIDAAGNKILTFDGTASLLQVRNSLFVIAFFYPIWIWFSTSNRNMLTGGKGSLSSMIDWIISGPLQMGFLALEMYLMVDTSEYMQHNFWLSYGIFFLTDLIKLVAQEILYYRSNWAVSITKPQEQAYQAHAKDEEEDLAIKVRD